MTEISAILACKGRRSGKPHRPVVIYAHAQPWPLPAGWSLRSPHATLDLHCRRCGFAPRTSDEGLRALLEMAAGNAARTLYIDGP